MVQLQVTPPPSMTPEMLPFVTRSILQRWFSRTLDKPLFFVGFFTVQPCCSVYVTVYSNLTHFILPIKSGGRTKGFIRSSLRMLTM